MIVTHYQPEEGGSWAACTPDGYDSPSLAHVVDVWLRMRPVYHAIRVSMDHYNGPISVNIALAKEPTP